MAHRARLLLALAAVVLAAAALAVPAYGTRNGPARTISAVNSLEPRILAQINAVRAQYGLQPLRPSAKLSAAADQHSVQMGKLGYFSHDSADGSPFSARVRRFYRVSGFRFWSVGENLLWASPSVDSSGALRMWMQSPGHRENLLNANWREIGLSAVHVVAAPGAYHGLDVTIVTADFGVRH